MGWVEGKARHLKREPWTGVLTGKKHTESGGSPEIKIRTENGDPAENPKSGPFYKEFIFQIDQFQGGRRKSNSDRKWGP